MSIPACELKWKKCGQVFPIASGELEDNLRVFLIHLFKTSALLAQIPDFKINLMLGGDMPATFFLRR